MDAELRPSPRIERDAWGVLEIAGHGRVKDAKLWPGGGRPWDWSETGTAHRPGIQPADVAELLDHGAEVVVLGTGRQDRLGVTDATTALLRQRDVGVHVAPTGEAIAVYNRLVESGRAVGALVHSTC